MSKKKIRNPQLSNIKKLNGTDETDQFHFDKWTFIGISTQIFGNLSELFLTFLMLNIISSIEYYTK